jgi:BlaR1 peptidase M56
MEALSLYILKSSGLIALFYLAYHTLLRKETFFTSNRWFLLAGLFTSALLPLLFYTTIVWVEPTPINHNWSKVPLNTPIQKESFEMNWYLVLVVAYSIGIALFLIQFAIDFYQLNRVLKGKNMQRQADHKFIDLKDNIAPFSYFNTIVFNSDLYTKSELESILEHEKIHSEQWHTIDVLIIRFFCILFWFNPFIWLYKKALLLNLEFIADSEAFKNISDKKTYQLTLLKITTHENCVAITSPFYQSLIKKRIVMLNKNQSKKWNSWKYALVLPALGMFVFLFQMEVIAQEKITPEKNYNQTSSELVDIYKINKSTTDSELQEKAKLFNDKYDIKTTFSKVKRNAKNELIGLKIKLQKGKETATTMEVNNNEPLKEFGIAISKNDDGTTNIGIVTDKKQMKIANGISSIDNIPIPAAPPMMPEFPNDPMPKMPEIDMSKMPTPPSPPTNTSDKIAMKQYQKEMEDFEIKMENFEPDTNAFDKAMEVEMEKREAIFEKEMEKYEIAMEERREAMEIRKEAIRDEIEAKKEVAREHEKNDN